MWERPTLLPESLTSDLISLERLHVESS
jgi:hypothetical protein